MLVPGSNRRIFTVDRHLGVVRIIVFHNGFEVESVVLYVALFSWSFDIARAIKAVTGIAADGRKLASEAKAHARTYRRNFGSPIPPKVRYLHIRHVWSKISHMWPSHGFIAGSCLTNRKLVARVYMLRRTSSFWQLHFDLRRWSHDQTARTVHVRPLRGDTGNGIYN